MKVYIIVFAIIIVVAFGLYYLTFLRQKPATIPSDERGRAIVLAQKKLDETGLKDRKLVDASPVESKPHQWLVTFASPNATDSQVWITVNTETNQILEAKTPWGAL